MREEVGHRDASASTIHLEAWMMSSYYVELPFFVKYQVTSTELVLHSENYFIVQRNKSKRIIDAGNATDLEKDRVRKADSNRDASHLKSC